MTGIQLIFDGLSVGALYALIAIAMVIIYKASEVPNFGQGAMAMFSAYIAYHLMTIYGFNFAAAFFGALIFAFALGVVIEFTIIRRAKEPNILNLILITIGVERILYGLAGWKWGADGKQFPSSFDPLPFTRSDMIPILGMPVSVVKIIVVLVAVFLIVVFYLFFKYSKVGIAMKATQQNRIAAMINGIRTNRIMSLTWALSSMVGAIAGMMIVPATASSLSSSMMIGPLLKGFAAAVLGGMTTLVGAIGGGFILGIIEKFFGYYVSTEFETVVAFAIIVLILWFKPEGLFGKHKQKKV